MILFQDLDEVRLGLLCHISDFLALTNEDVKSTYLTKMSDFLLRFQIIFASPSRVKIYRNLEPG